MEIQDPAHQVEGYVVKCPTHDQKQAPRNEPINMN